MFAALTPERRELPTATEALSWFAPLVEQFEMAEPMLVVGGEDGQVSIPLGDFAERVPEGVVVATAMGRLYGFVPTWLLVTSEAWQRSFSPDDPQWEKVADSMKHGDLERAAELGDDRVIEIVSMWGRRADGTGYLARCPFKRVPGLDGFTVTWGELEEIPLDTEGVELAGDMIHAMAHAMEHEVVSHEPNEPSNDDGSDLRLRRSPQ